MFVDKSVEKRNLSILHLTEVMLHKK
jgi:hypothetical protein